MKNIQELHNNVFDFLNNWSEGSPAPFGNRFFYLRMKEDERFKKGYWFPGDEQYVAISFWTGGDALNKTPNIFISFTLNKGIDAYLIARDSENKRRYFEKNIVPKLKGYKPNKKRNVWKKSLANSIDDNFLDVLNDFILNDKEIIDKILKDTLENVDEPDANLLEDEYSSKFGFISEEQFYKQKTKVEYQKIKIEADSTNIESAFDDLPIALINLSIENFQGIEKAEVEDLPKNAKWIFLTGENGFGKTSVLQAIALGLTNFDENREYLKNKTKIDIMYKTDDEIVLNSSAFAFSDSFISLNSNFIAYGPVRLNSQASSSETQETKNSNNVYNLFNKDGLVKNVNYLFQISSLKDNKEEFENLKNAVIKIVDYRIVDIIINKYGEVEYSEADGNGNILGKNTLEHLATGFQGLINLVGDIISRFSKEFPGKRYAEYKGIIVIDELENHLHPIFQKMLPKLLSELFPCLQFISSVHSPIPLLGAPTNSIILKVNRDFEKQITIEKVVIDNIDSLNPNLLLTSPIFGFSSIISDNLIDKRQLRTEDSWDQVKNNKELDKELLELYNSRIKKD